MPAILWTTTSALLMMSANPVTEQRLYGSQASVWEPFLKGVYQDEKLHYIKPYQAGEGEGCGI